jgi:hypothetical protein
MTLRAGISWSMQVLAGSLAILREVVDESTISDWENVEVGGRRLICDLYYRDEAMGCLRLRAELRLTVGIVVMELSLMSSAISFLICRLNCQRPDHWGKIILTW